MSQHVDESVLLSEDPPLDLRLSEAELERTRERIVSFIADIVDDAGADGRWILSGGRASNSEPARGSHDGSDALHRHSRMTPR